MDSSGGRWTSRWIAWRSPSNRHARSVPLGSAIALLAASATAGPAHARNDAGDPAAETTAVDAGSGDVIEAPPPLSDDAARLEVVLRGGVWLPRPGGDFSLDGGGAAGTTFKFDADFGVDDMEPSFSGEIELSFDDQWLVRASGFDFSTSASGRAARSGRFGDLLITAGDPVIADLDLWSFAVEAGWRWDPFGRRDAPDQEADIFLRPVVGVRWVEVEQQITRRGTFQAQSASSDWLVLTAGLELALAWEPSDGLLLGEALRLEAGGAIGPAVTNDYGFAWQVRAQLTWEVIDGVEAMFGYRLLELEVEDGGYDFGGGLQGLFVGGTLRF